MNKKTIAFIVIIIVVLAVGIYVFRNLRQQPVQTIEQTTQMENKEEIMKDPGSTKISQWAFVDGDALHKGSGEAVVYQTKEGPILAFENFSVTVGPDVFVYLSKNDFSGKRDLGEFVSLGKIKDFKGDQTYNLPENYQDYQSVLIWCRAFGVLFAYSPLQ